MRVRAACLLRQRPERQGWRAMVTNWDEPGWRSRLELHLMFTIEIGLNVKLGREHFLEVT
jgi:hypothetical protein